MSVPTPDFNAEEPPAVFRALLDELDQREDWTAEDRARWEDRQRNALRARRAMCDYNRAWDRSLASVTYGGQGGG
jgi:hypothetical protein